MIRNFIFKHRNRSGTMEPPALGWDFLILVRMAYYVYSCLRFITALPKYSALS